MTVSCLFMHALVVTDEMNANEETAVEGAHSLCMGSMLETVIHSFCSP